MANTPETKLQRKIRDRLKEEFPGIFLFKKHGGPHSPKGIPDFVGCFNGLFFGLEVKVPGREDTLTKYQSKSLKDIRAAGGVADMVTSPDQAYHVLRKALKNMRIHGRPYKK